jgi:hypothetical protein
MLTKFGLRTEKHRLKNRIKDVLTLPVAGILCESN